MSRHHAIGTPGDFLKVIAQSESAPRYLIILGHGAEEGLHFGRYAPFIDTSMLVDENLPPRVITEHVALRGCTVIADCCYGAAPEMVKAFLAGGAAGFIGSSKALGVELSVFLVNFFFQVLSNGLSDAQAMERAVQATGEKVESVRYFAGK